MKAQFYSVFRKANQVVKDPVLRRWLVGKLLGKFSGKRSFDAIYPPYLENDQPFKFVLPDTSHMFAELSNEDPTVAIKLRLPGIDMTLNPGEESKFVAKKFVDTEVLLAIHRFAWLPLLGANANQAWVNKIWNAWYKNYREVDRSWAWHPYTATERAINILRYGRIYGLPGPVDECIDFLAQHSLVIKDRLEYFGENHTSNHLANNGRGLFLLGLWLDMPDIARIGGRILIKEAARIFSDSGMLREGSSHYQLLLAKNYGEAAKEAEAYGRYEAPILRKIAKKTSMSAKALILPGGLPLIGDISPDCPPNVLVEKFICQKQFSTQALDGDGWLRHDWGPWSGLWHISPNGWRQIPGHGHEDCGGFELHFKGTPIFIDPGRGSYNNGKEASFACSGQSHNTLLINDQDPFPPNRPYYQDEFRDQFGLGKPELNKFGSKIFCTHKGFSRLGNIGPVYREWDLENDSLAITDSVEGKSTCKITRLLVTPLSAQIVNNVVIIRDNINSFKVSALGSKCSLVPVSRWTAYGVGDVIKQIRFEVRKSLPWTGKIMVEKV